MLDTLDTPETPARWQEKASRRHATHNHGPFRRNACCCSIDYRKAEIHLRTCRLGWSVRCSVNVDIRSARRGEVTVLRSLHVCLFRVGLVSSTLPQGRLEHILPVMHHLCVHQRDLHLFPSPRDHLSLVLVQSLFLSLSAFRNSCEQP